MGKAFPQEELVLVAAVHAASAQLYEAHADHSVIAEVLKKYDPSGDAAVRAFNEYRNPYYKCGLKLEE